MAFPFMEAVVGLEILMYIFETYLHLRQHAALKLRTLPKTLVGVISQETFEKYRAYNIDKSNLRFVKQFVTIIIDSATLLFGVLPRLWKVKSGDIVESTGLDAENEIYQTLAFLACVMYWSQITNLPFSLYSTFVIEERHGFNKQTFWLFIRDMLKGMTVAIVLGPPIVAAIILIVQKSGPYLAIYLWGFIFVLSLFMMTIYPVLVPPLYNKLTPLPQGELRTKIETLASSQNFPSKKLFVVDGSTWSTHSNCTNEEEIVAVIAHELGHWKLNHKIYSSVGVQILILLLFGGYTLVKNSNDLFTSFGFDTQPVLIEFILFQYTIIPVQHLVSFDLNLVTHAFEFQADAFAKKLGYAKPLRDALVKMQVGNLSEMNTDPWYSVYHYSHPTLLERLAALDEPHNKAD
ncbi:CAAX prenyl protease 1 homolog isoform X3 [Helianthus annuus]|uniref:CAAX prenyl protease 1 homolog isoform X3 n=1 Tax=Helianthus annuus TaxID=4232 RepID=UPI000B8FFB5C|nr:CAAX prenyl protease 1 homolog isoform X3 [Helianthus annuus]